MRHAIWKSTDFFQHINRGRLDMDVTAIQAAKETLPVMSNFNPEKPPIGWVSDIRVEDGDLTGEVEWRTDMFDDELLERLNCRFGGTYRNIEKTEDGSRVTSAVLYCISIMSERDTPKE